MCRMRKSEAWEHSIVSPLIAALPFWFRLMQCARRFRDTGQKRHLLNLGKYASSLLVVVVGTQAWPKLVLILASAIATVYSAGWDVCMDWGLSYRELCGGSTHGSSFASPFSNYDGANTPSVIGTPTATRTFISMVGQAGGQSAVQGSRY